MAINWINGEASYIDVLWQEISEEIQINPNKELVSIQIQCINNAESSGYFDKLSIKENLTNEKINGNSITYIPIEQINIGNSICEVPVFAAVKNNKISAIHILTSDDIVGSDMDTIKLSIVNKVTGDIISTKTFVSGVNAINYNLCNFGAVDLDKQNISTGTGLCLRIDPINNNKIFPQSVLVIEWDIN
ncbi:MAG: hypothetical protein K0R54_4828 [Clostridiaceae bacterium]|jgi:hypothetical protein|nr:hypothetical protein [Clostridiaceae bacterium]